MLRELRGPHGGPHAGTRLLALLLVLLLAGPLTYVLEMCEWDPGHDRQRLMMVARVLIENGAPYATRNVWGDTAYSIARAQRYCGPDHPVTRLIRAMCGGGDNAPRDQCMASYELARGEHFPGSRKPKPRRLLPASLPATQRP